MSGHPASSLLLPPAVTGGSRRRLSKTASRKSGCESGAAHQAGLGLVAANQASALLRGKPPSTLRRSSHRGSCEGSAALASVNQEAASQSLQHGEAEPLQSEASTIADLASGAVRCVGAAGGARVARGGEVCPVPTPDGEAGDLTGSDLIPTLLLGVGVGPSGAAQLLETLHSLESDESARTARLTQLKMVTT